MMKRVLSILLAAVLLLSAFTALPMTAGAEDADLADTSVTVIKSFEVTDVDAPKPGTMPAYCASVPSGKGYEVQPTNYSTTLYSGVSWYNVTDEKAINSSDRFVSGKQYKVTVFLQPASLGYEFASSGLTATLNTHNAAVRKLGEGSVSVSYTFTCRSMTSVSSVSVTVTAPVAGQKPSYVSTVPSGNGYSVRDVDDNLYQDGVNWCIVSGDNYYSVSPSSTFVNGEQYMVTVLLKPTDEYYVFSNSVSGTVNGKTAAVKKSYTNPDYRYIEYTFTCQANPSKVTVSGTATSYLNDTDSVRIMLLQNGSKKYSTTVTGMNAAYSIPNVTKGSYTLRVEKLNHVTRDYSVTLSGNTTQNVTICPLGDANLNGKVQANDAMMAYQHAQGKADMQLTDYAFKCADVAPVGEPNGKVQAADAMLIYQQSQGKHVLY